MRLHGVLAAAAAVSALGAGCPRPEPAGRDGGASSGAPVSSSRSTSARAAGSSGCLTLAGDLLLSRGVARALGASREPFWGPLGLSPGERWVANLEGTLAPAGSACAKEPALCLAIAPATLSRLRGGPFAALSLANNHSGDVGAAGARATAAALRALGLTPLEEDAGPQPLTVDGVPWALVAVNLVNRGLAEVQLALEATRLRIGLGLARAGRVVVLPHWGREYQEHADAGQWRAAEVFRAWGASVVAGAHGHVIMESRCEGGASLHFGLGNLLFDQRPAATRLGQVVRCCPEGDGLACQAARTRVGEPPAAVTWADPAPHRWSAPCVVPPPAAFTRDERLAWQRHPAAARFVFVQPFRSLGPRTFFALHRSHSDYDHEHALRPYVFTWRAGGTAISGAAPRWRCRSRPRGSSLWAGGSACAPCTAATLSWPCSRPRWRGDGPCIIGAASGFRAYATPRP